MKLNNRTVVMKTHDLIYQQNSNQHPIDVQGLILIKASDINLGLQGIEDQKIIDSQ